MKISLGKSWKFTEECEGAGLESLYTVKGIVGSNPTLSAINLNFSTFLKDVKIDLIAMWSQLKDENEKTFKDLGSGFVVMKAFIDWHKKYVEWWKKKLKKEWKNF